MRILLTGASGYVGKAVAGLLLSRGHTVHALHRVPPAKPKNDGYNGKYVVCVGSLSDTPALLAAAKGCEAAVHLVGIIAEQKRHGITFRSVHVDGTANLIAACQSAGVPRLIHMSALGTRSGAVAEYHRTKWEAEELVRKSPLASTIFRPGMILSPPPGASPDADPGEFTRMVAGWSNGSAPPFLFFPYFSAGVLGFGRKSLLQPVRLTEVARAFADALENRASQSKTYALALPPPALTFPQLYRLIARTHHLRVRPAIPIPAWYARLLAHVVPASLLPFNLSQVQMAAEDNTASPEQLSAFATDFGWSPAWAPGERE